MPHYKLTYFQIRGLGEGARLLFAYGGVDYEDVRINMDDWPKIKPTMPYFKQMPLLEVDGVLIPQSAAINRYLGKQFGLLPECPVEAALVDAIYDAHKDFITEAKPYLYICFEFAEGDKEKQLKEAGIPARNKYFNGLREFLAKSGSGYLVGKKISWADIVIADHLATLSQFFPTIYDGYPEVKAFVEKILHVPQIKQWIEKRPKTKF